MASSPPVVARVIVTRDDAVYLDLLGRIYWVARNAHVERCPEATDLCRLLENVIGEWADQHDMPLPDYKPTMRLI